MNSNELRASFLQEVDAILDNDELVKKARIYIRNIKGELLEPGKAAFIDPEFPPYSKEELEARIKKAEKNIAAGNTVATELVMKNAFNLISSL
ncbi:MAG: hypothetical protein RR365_05055 [Bacteroides sp.]